MGGSACFWEKGVTYTICRRNMLSLRERVEEKTTQLETLWKREGGSYGRVAKAEP